MRKRPVQPRAERTLRTIFEAVAQIVSGEGEEALTTNRIAERSGYSVGTIVEGIEHVDPLLQRRPPPRGEAGCAGG